MSEIKYCEFIAICGKPNVGKSTLLNKLVGQKVAIVSPRPQTTRNRITGILNDGDMQLVFMDTPGMHKPKTDLGRFMVKSVEDTSSGVDIVLFVVEPAKRVHEAENVLIENFKRNNIPVILVINKIDTVKKEEIMPVIDMYSKLMDFESVIPISAKHGDGRDILLNEIKKYANESVAFFPEDMICDQPERQMIAEIIREKMLRLLDKEVPHGIAVEVESFTQREDNEYLYDAHITIYCEKSSHKGIIIGKNGEMIKKISSYARQDIEQIFDCKVNLQTWVKVKEDWRNNRYAMRNFGYDL